MPTDRDIQTFEDCRPALLALAYRMLGEIGRAEDMVQDAWLRWSSRRDREVDSPKAYLLKVVTRLCLNDLDSARSRREHPRSDRLPEPVDLDGMAGKVEAVDRISMAFLVVLQRLTPAERAVLLLHDVFDFSHAEVGEILAKSEDACRQLLRRAHANVDEGPDVGAGSDEEHRRLLRAFLGAAMSGRVDELTKILADDAVLVADGGATPNRFGRIRNVPVPVTGAARIAAFVAAVTPEGSRGLVTRECMLNHQPAVVAFRDGRPVSAILLAVADGRIRRVFIQADPARLQHLGANTQGWTP